MLRSQHESSQDSKLGLLDLILLGVGAIIGGGIFASLGTAAIGSPQRLGAGPSLVLSCLLCAIVCACTALTFGELASRLPKAGSAYVYTRSAFGDFVGWLIGWCLILEYGIANVAVALSWGDFFRAFLHRFNIDLPAWLSSPVLGALVVLSLTLLLLRGLKTSSRVSNFLVVCKCLVLLLFVGLGFYCVGPQHLVDNSQPWMPHGVRGTLNGAAVIFFSFIGFDAVATVAEEVHDAQRTLPWGILISLLLSAGLYMLVAAVFCGAMPFAAWQTTLVQPGAQAMPLAVASFGPSAAWAQGVIAFGALLAQTSALLAFQVAQARVLMALARDGFLPRQLANQGGLVRCTLLAGGLVAGLCFVQDLTFMLDLTDVGVLGLFAVTNLSLPVLRAKSTGPAAFSVPFGPYVIPCLGTVSCVALMLVLPAACWNSFAAWLSLGAGIFIVRRALV